MFRYGLTVTSIAIAAALALLWVFLERVHAHDYKRHDLDSWYSSLHRKGLSVPCCSKQDCHTTEAELRDGIWWARLRIPVDRPDGERDWTLGEYVRIPDDLIVRGENGFPIANPEGEAVICHDTAWAGGKISTAGTVVWCFVPGAEG